MFTETEIGPGGKPEVGEMESQFPPLVVEAVAVQTSNELSEVDRDKT
jgi:hypothetical protein